MDISDMRFVDVGGEHIVVLPKDDKAVLFGDPVVIGERAEKICQMAHALPSFCVKHLAPYWWLEPTQRGMQTPIFERGII